MANKIFILSATHNDLANIKRLLASLKKQTYSSCEIVIVDDGSTDGTREYLRENYPEVEVLEGSGDLWWTGALFKGVNYILESAGRDDYILTINNDCQVDENYLETIENTSRKNDRAIVGSLVVDINNPDEIIDAGVKLDWKKGEIVSLEKEGDKRFQKDIDTLTTKGTLYPIEVFEEIGNFDKKHFPHYVSDYEFACRAKRAGFNLMLDYKAVVYNDPTNTGFGSRQQFEDLRPKNLFKILFSKKSQVNIIDQINFIRFCASGKYKLRNYLILLKKVFLRLLNSVKKGS